MNIVSACSTEKDPVEAVDACFSQLTDGRPEEISWLCIYHSDGYSSSAVVDRIAALPGRFPVHGGTSCMGVMSSEGYFNDEGMGMGMLAISDPMGAYGVGASDIGEQPQAAAKIALERALSNAQRDGEVPAMVWMNAAPGKEELLIRGIEDVLGPDVPIAGGSTGDNTISGNWRQIAGGEVFQDAVVISVFFPSVKLHYAFHSGYDPTSVKGKVTKAEGRTLFEINNQPAAEIYNQWTQGLISDEIATNGNVLSKTTLAPLGREMGRIGDIPYYKLTHPYEVTPEGAIILFADVETGDEVVLMTGSRHSLVTRAGRVSKSAIADGGFDPGSIVGAIVIYCAGCMLTVQADMQSVADEIDAAVGNAPFLGIFTFGEQGCFVGNKNNHGNLMISVVTFSNTPEY